MKISTRTRYGFRFMLNLGLEYGNGVCQLSQIAEKEEISDKYLEQIVKLLKVGGFIQSVRGAKGGYSLIKPPSEINLGDLFETLEGELILVECLASDASCSREKKCGTYDVWYELKEHMKSFFSDKSLEYILNIYTKKNDINMYYI